MRTGLRQQRVQNRCGHIALRVQQEREKVTSRFFPAPALPPSAPGFS